MLEYLNETVYVEVDGKEIPVGMAKDYLFIDESETRRRLYKRLNEKRLFEKAVISIDVCEKLAEKIQSDLHQGEGVRFVKIGDRIIDKANMSESDEDLFFCEMAQIYSKYFDGKKSKIYFEVWVRQREEGPVPHVHVAFGKIEDLKTPISYICLNKAEYASWHKNGKILTIPEKKKVIEFFNTFRDGAFSKDKDGKPIPCNCWKEAVDIYLASFNVPDNIFKRDADGMIIMPDYSELPTKGS